MDNTVIFRLIFAPTVKNYHSTPTVIRTVDSVNYINKSTL
jgi:hypothetical protein